MKKIELESIGLLLIMVTAVGIAAAESETTYDNWTRMGIGGHAPLRKRYTPKHYMNKYEEMFPDAYGDRTWGPGRL